MRQSITIGSLIGAGLIILGQFGFFNSLLMFLLVGAIPGTNASISSGTMLFLIVGLASLVIFWATRQASRSRPTAATPAK